VLRRVLLTVSLAALGLAGAASATLLGGTAPSPGADTTSSATSASTTGASPTVPAPVPPITGGGTAPVTILISGHGWGHGMGMAQWGTLGFARNGWSYERILGHYYRGTTLEQRGNPTVRVLLLEGRKRVVLASEDPWSVSDARGAKLKLEPGSLILRPGLAVEGRKLVSPLTFDPGAAPLSVAGKPYRGRFVVHSSEGKLQVVNALRLESYVKGVVPYEVPSDWPAAALQAQAVAARTYALERLGAVGPGRDYDVYADVRSQVYGGIEGETASISGAVDATARRVLTHGGKVITAYYSSSSGGRTVSAADWLGTPVPYLVSVDDPYDTISPNHDWGPVLFDARKIAKALKLGRDLLDLRTTTGASGRVTAVTAVGVNGEVTVTGAEIRTLLGLRSTWFTLGWLSLDPPAPAAFGAVTRLTGIARGAGDVTLEAKTSDGDWETVRAVEPDANGVFAVTVRPESAAQYRIAAGDVQAGPVSLTVVPVVDASVAAGSVRGTVRPALSGASVQLQRQHGASWATVATATPDTTGSFAVSKPLGPGSYRVRWAPGRGLAPGVSQLLAVP
jgi:stage II sporulation protein D